MAKARVLEAMMRMQEPDPVIDEIREIRHQISEQFGHDPAKLVAHLQHFQEQYRDRFIDAPKVPEKPKDQSVA